MSGNKSRTTSRPCMSRCAQIRFLIFSIKDLGFDFLFFKSLVGFLFECQSISLNQLKVLDCGILFESCDFTLNQ